MTDFFLGQAAIVIIADHHNVFEIDPHRLEERGVVPTEWEIRESMMSPLKAVISYENGVTIEATPTRLDIADVADTQDISDIALAYLNAFPRLAYRELGLNMQLGAKVSVPPRQWLTSQARSAKAVDASVSRMTLQAKLNERAIMQIEISSGTAVQRNADDPQEHEVLVMDVNIHHPKGLPAEGLSQAVRAWPDYSKILDATVKSIIGEQEHEDL